MLQSKFFIFKIKNSILPLCIYIFTVFLVLYSSSNLEAAKSGLILWASCVIPSLFPFFIATELLSYTNFVNLLGKFLDRFMKPIFNVPGEGAFALIMGIISGYPVGAKIVSNLKMDGICTDLECERLISFTNNSGPLFIIGTVGISLFKSQEIGFKLLATHILSCLIVGFLFRWWKANSISESLKKPSLGPNNSKKNHYKILFSNLGEVLFLSIQSAIKTVLIIGGFVVLFAVIVSMMTSSHILSFIVNIISPIFKLFNIPSSYINSIIIGILEVTNGVKYAAISNSKIAIIICSFLLGFGGISVLLQVLSITSKAKISIKPYIIGKLLQATLSAFLMYFII